MATRQTRDNGLGREVWTVALVAMPGMMMVILDTTIVNVALDTLARDLHSPLSTIQWVSSGYLLSLALVIPASGWMVERFGSKRIWLASLAAFGICSALCGLAWSDTSLIVFRVLQGLGGGMVMPVGQSLVAQAAGPQRFGRAMSVIGVAILLGPVLGPVIGGAIVDGTSWRWIFYVNVPLAAIALTLAARFLGPASGRADAGRIDWRGLLLASPGLVGIVFGLSEIETQGGIGQPIAFGPILAGVILLVAFARYSYRAPRPLIDIRLFRSRGFSAASATVFVAGGALFGTTLVLPLYYQLARGADPLIAGLLLAPQGVGAAMVIPIAGRLTDRIGGGPVALFGTIVLALGTIPYAFVGADTSHVVLGASQVVRGIGLGCTLIPSQAAAYAVLSSAEVPRATSVLNAIQRVGGAVSVALLAVVLEHQLAAMSAGSGTGAAGLSAAPGASADVATAFAHTFRWAIALQVLAVIPAAILARTQYRDRRTAAGATQHRAPASAQPAMAPTPSSSAQSLTS
jgi:EmrB/QacA subfamily drug resistance transporter